MLILLGVFPGEDGEPAVSPAAAGKAADAAKVEQGRTTQTTGRRGYSGNEAGMYIYPVFLCVVLPHLS